MIARSINTANEIIDLIKDIDVSREYYYLTETYDIWVSRDTSFQIQKTVNIFTAPIKSIS